MTGIQDLARLWVTIGRFAPTDNLLVILLSAASVSHPFPNDAEAIEVIGDGRIIRPERLLPDRQRTFVGGLRSA